MNYPLAAKNSPEWLAPVKDKAFCFGGEMIKIDLNAGVYDHSAVPLDLEDNLSSKHVAVQDPLQYPQVHFALIGFGERGSHIALMDQQTPVRFGNLESFHFNYRRERYPGFAIKLVKWIQQTRVPI
jgi:hypothetical protein